jgi:hypothetical protein
MRMYVYIRADQVLRLQCKRYIHTRIPENLDMYSQGKSSAEIQAFVNDRVCQILAWGRKGLIHALQQEGYMEFVKATKGTWYGMGQEALKKVECMSNMS